MMTTRRVVSAVFCVALSTAGLPALSCQQAPGSRPPPVPTGKLSLRPIPVPGSVFTVAGEVQAYEAIGTGHQDLSVDLEAWESTFGPIERVLVIEFDAAGRASSYWSPVKSRTATFPATARSKYLIYADLGPRFWSTYRLLCWLDLIVLPAERGWLPEICTRILCSDEPFLAHSLLQDYPGLEGRSERFAGAQDLVGGFRGHPGLPCERCTGSWASVFFPVDNCRDVNPFDPPPVAEPACRFAGWAPFTAEDCATPSREEDRTWSEWTEFYRFYAGDDTAALTINLASQIACAGFGCLLDLVATYDDVQFFPRHLHVRGLGSPALAHVEGNPVPLLEDSFVGFKSSTEFENGDHGRRLHRLFVRWSLPWGCSTCPKGFQLLVKGNVRDSRILTLEPITACEEPPPISAVVTGLGMTDAVAINESNVVAGFHRSNDVYAARVWKDGTAHHLGDPGGRGRTVTFDINDSGVVIGDTKTSSGRRAVRWTGFPPVFDTYLGIDGGIESLAIGINNAGQVAGRNDLGLGAWRLDPGQGATSLPSLPGNQANLAIAYKINDAGYVSGMTRNPGSPPHLNFAVLWDPAGNPVNLGSPDADEAIARDVNAGRTVVGTSFLGDNLLGGKRLATIWTWNQESGTHEAALLPAHPSLPGDSVARALNDKGDVVGFIRDANGTAHAVLWRDGVAIDLNDEIPPGSGWFLRTASDLNEGGFIVGNGVNPQGLEEAYLFTP